MKIITNILNKFTKSNEEKFYTAEIIRNHSNVAGRTVTKAKSEKEAIENIHAKLDCKIVSIRKL